MAQGLSFELKDEDWSPQEIYQQIYYDYQASCYDEALQQLDTEIPKLGDKEIIPKFELLRALILLKTDNKSLGFEALQRLIDTYPPSEETKYAEELLKLNTPI
jgi:outer membrane protein assembly factor BamD (BamD/ComL family)